MFYSSLTLTLELHNAAVILVTYHWMYILSTRYILETIRLHDATVIPVYHWLYIFVTCYIFTTSKTVQCSSDACGSLDLYICNLLHIGNIWTPRCSSDTCGSFDVYISYLLFIRIFGLQQLLFCTS